MMHFAHVFKSSNDDGPYYAFSIQSKDPNDMLVRDEYVFEQRYATQEQAQEAARAEIMKLELEARRA